MPRVHIKAQVITYSARHRLDDHAIDTITDTVAATAPESDEELDVEISCTVNEYRDGTIAPH